ncbi:MAG: Gfo/Idh/MocA family oxidoreductase [Verrucomicrobiota bacterium]
MNVSAAKRDLGLIGAGYWGKNLARNFHALGVLHTICDAESSVLAAYQNGYELVRKSNQAEDLLQATEINKVAIAAPAAMHYRLARAALLAGKDVFVEKPLCLKEEEGDDLVALAEQQKRVLMVGHLLQYHPAIETLKTIIARGELGKLYYLTSNRLNLGKIRREENALWSFAPHDISVILSLVGLPEHVRCVGEAYLRDGVPDTTLMMLTFPDRVRAHAYVSWLNPFKEQKLTIVGSSGMAVFDDTLPWKEKLVVHRDHVMWVRGQTPTPSKSSGEAVHIPEVEPLSVECRHFLDRCADRSRPLTDGTEGLRVLRVLRAAQTSLESGGELVALKR